jgi:hypothetical protein
VEVKAVVAAEAAVMFRRRAIGPTECGLEKMKIKRTSVYIGYTSCKPVPGRAITSKQPRILAL